MLATMSAATAAIVVLLHSLPAAAGGPGALRIENFRFIYRCGGKGSTCDPGLSSDQCGSDREGVPIQCVPGVFLKRPALAGTALLISDATPDGAPEALPTVTVLLEMRKRGTVHFLARSFSTGTAAWPDVGAWFPFDDNDNDDGPDDNPEDDVDDLFDDEPPNYKFVLACAGLKDTGDELLALMGAVAPQDNAGVFLAPVIGLLRQRGKDAGSNDHADTVESFAHVARYKVKIQLAELTEPPGADCSFVE